MRLRDGCVHTCVWCDGGRRGQGVTELAQWHLSPDSQSSWRPPAPVLRNEAKAATFKKKTEWVTHIMTVETTMLLIPLKLLRQLFYESPIV